MEQDKAFKETKNYIHNELGITKEDIRKIIKGMVREEIKKVLKDESNIGTTIENVVDELVKESVQKPNSLYHNFKQRVEHSLSENIGNFIIKQLDVKIDLKEKTTDTNNEETKLY